VALGSFAAVVKLYIDYHTLRRNVRRVKTTRVCDSEPQHLRLVSWHKHTSMGSGLGSEVTIQTTWPFRHFYFGSIKFLIFYKHYFVIGIRFGVMCTKYCLFPFWFVFVSWQKNIFCDLPRLTFLMPVCNVSTYTYQDWLFCIQCLYLTVFCFLDETNTLDNERLHT